MDCSLIALLVGWQEGHSACKKLHQLIPGILRLGVDEENQGRSWLTQVLVEIDR